MEKIAKYKKILENVLEKHSKIMFENMPLVKSIVIIDKPKKHFILMDMGWSNLGFIHKWVFHFEIKDEKIHLHKNRTDFDIVGALCEEGIEKNDIVITILNEPESLAPPQTQLEEAA